MNITRRKTERISLKSSSLSATWLSDWDKVSETGSLLNISAGGFGARMAKAPVNGRLFHARLSLRTPHGETISQPIEVDARVCGRVHSTDAAGDGRMWIVHCAIEAIRPVDEDLMRLAIGTPAPPGP